MTRRLLWWLALLGACAMGSCADRRDAAKTPASWEAINAKNAATADRALDMLEDEMRITNSLRAELAAVRDSLAQERADLIDCYQGKRVQP
jgi:hypothetical protein